MKNLRRLSLSVFFCTAFASCSKDKILNDKYPLPKVKNNCGQVIKSNNDTGFIIVRWEDGTTETIHTMNEFYVRGMEYCK